MHPNSSLYSCPVNKGNKKLFDFSIKRIFMKLFRSGSVALVEDCQRFLSFLPVSYQVDVRTAKFLQKYKATENRICSLLGDEADRQLRNLCTIYTVSQKKLGHYTFVRNFDKCWPIFKILSLVYSPRNLRQNSQHFAHHTSDVSLHYLAKYKRTKLAKFCCI